MKKGWQVELGSEWICIGSLRGVITTESIIRLGASQCIQPPLIYSAPALAQSALLSQNQRTFVHKCCTFILHKYRMRPVICVPLHWQSSVVCLWKKFYASSSQEPIHKREKRWPGCSVFIDDDKPCRRCHSNHPPCTQSPCSQQWQWQCDREHSLILSLWSRCYLRRLCHCFMTATFKAEVFVGNVG